MTYSQKLRDPRWQKKRLLILERDHWKCQCCGTAEKNLQVHHLFYAKLDPWDYPEAAYQTLCEDCHQERQGAIDGGIEGIRMDLAHVPTRILGRVLFSMQQHMAEAVNYFSDPDKGES